MDLPRRFGKAELNLRGDLLKLNRFIVPIFAAVAVALSGAGIAAANPSEEFPTTSGFVDKAVVKPTCDDPALTFSGRYVGPGASLRLEREIEIEGGVMGWIGVANEGVIAYRNGEPVSGFDRDIQDGHVTVSYGDTFEISQYGYGNTQIFRLQVLMDGNPEFTEIGDTKAEFPVFESCKKIEARKSPAAA